MYRIRYIATGVVICPLCCVALLLFCPLPQVVTTVDATHASSLITADLPSGSAVIEYRCSTKAWMEVFGVVRLYRYTLRAGHDSKCPRAFYTV